MASAMLTKAFASLQNKDKDKDDLVSAIRKERARRAEELLMPTDAEKEQLHNRTRNCYMKLKLLGNIRKFELVTSQDEDTLTTTEGGGRTSRKASRLAKQDSNVSITAQEHPESRLEKEKKARKERSTRILLKQLPLAVEPLEQATLNLCWTKFTDRTQRKRAMMLMTDVFHSLFESHPRTNHILCGATFMVDKSGYTRYTAERVHAERLYEMIQATLDWMNAKKSEELDKRATLMSFVVASAQCHAPLDACGFTGDAFEMFGECLVDTLLSPKNHTSLITVSPCSRQAWIKLFAFLTDQLRYYFDETQERQRRLSNCYAAKDLKRMIVAHRMQNVVKKIYNHRRRLSFANPSTFAVSRSMSIRPTGFTWDYRGHNDTGLTNVGLMGRKIITFDDLFEMTQSKNEEDKTKSTDITYRSCYDFCSEYQPEDELVSIVF